VGCLFFKISDKVKLNRNNCFNILLNFNIRRSEVSNKKLDTLPLFPNAKSSASGTAARTAVPAQRTEAEEDSILYWNKCLEIIKDNVSPQVFKTWFKPIRALNWEDDRLTVQVPSQFFCEWIEEHFYPLLQKTVYQVLGDNAKLQYQVVVDESCDTLENRTIRVPAFKYPPSAGAQTPLPFNQAPALVQQEFPSYLNPRYSFDNFIRGESNQLAGSAAMAVAQNPGGTRYNPLFIYGDVGLGKTHIAQAIGNYITQKNRKLRVLYTTSERFSIEFVNAIQNNKLNDFIGFYRSIDVLIVDDIQFLAGKEKTQDNFFHTFNALHQAGKQVVLTSDRSPKNIADIDERLISRFQWGLTVDIQPPDLEMRMAILQKKSEDEGVELPHDVVEFIARNVTSSIRELEGALIGLIAKNALDRRILNLELAQEVVKGVSGSKGEKKSLSIEEIKQAVAGFFKMSSDLLSSQSRKHEVALPRQMAMYLSKQLTQNSLKIIGSHFGGRDHSTVLHSCKAIENYLVTDKGVKGQFETLLGMLKQD
jgi:chromosomal replication initiator protein